MEISTSEIKQKRRPASEWQTLIKDWRMSGQSQRAFCEQHDLAISTFSKWVNKLSETSVEAERAFVELTSLPSRSDADSDAPWSVELDLGSGIVLRIAR